MVTAPVDPPYISNGIVTAFKVKAVDALNINLLPADTPHCCVPFKYVVGPTVPLTALMSCTQ